MQAHVHMHMHTHMYQTNPKNPKIPRKEKKNVKTGEIQNDTNNKVCALLIEIA